MNPLPIGAAARRTGCSVPTLRYYEDIGLVPPATRTAAGQRSYGEAELQRLGFIRRCRDFGFSIDQVRELLRLADQPDRPCVEARDIAAGQLADVRRRLLELHALESGLADFVRRCDSSCAGGAAQGCHILEDLAAPAAPRCCG